ncbi:glycyl-radical enzyme activating protein [Acidaminobacter hydrogenoformans]|uniref:Pyruvate formate lyase activating enzyme n=1 Tax=Acidaminobacter hydrogenoformans DSM 2784 TaxID=1120920 RepID=A0A1G5RWY1_9FIRM|nr:glycyl-radical enzyme activating protein [Acidaminobacter hydrogenoformans]SCZ77961.1 pyruvate formate lyase activating enzyme [Acidaminobacter hydrogenoformans DSM 2784]
MTGVVSQLQDFSIHDGDGIRTTIFLSGCPLRCKWCANPETWGRSPVIASHASRCIDCGRCLEACPVEAVWSGTGTSCEVWSGTGPACKGALGTAPPHHVDPSRCTLCGKCVEVCPSGAKAMMGSEMPVSEVVEKVMRNNIFFQASGGGVTFSGGEATLQTDFFNALARELYDLDVHLALETCGFFEWDGVAESLTLMDHIFFDLKLMDGQRHLEMTGRDNEKILENFRRLATLGVDVVVRIPVVPGVNDDEVNIEATALFVNETCPRATIELLPYHPYGNYKYEALNMMERLYKYEIPDEARMEALKELVERCGVRVVSYK